VKRTTPVPCCEKPPYAIAAPQRLGSALTALCSRKAVPPSGSRYRVIYRACSHRLDPAIFIFHFSFIIYHLSLSFQLALRHLMLYA
jgi:hypothetical protein